MRVLIVEDDEVIASTMSRGLALHGYVVEHVSSAEAASAALLSEQFDLAIVDLGLPQEDGTSLVRRIRRTNKTLPVVVVTARDSIADRVDTLDLGADDYLVKPVALAELLARCRAHIRRTLSRRCIAETRDTTPAAQYSRSARIRSPTVCRRDGSGSARIDGSRPASSESHGMMVKHTFRVSLAG
jgi:DNA-binding response OmpR family regulator